jgi:hypothetical protein
VAFARRAGHYDVRSGVVEVGVRQGNLLANLGCGELVVDLVADAAVAAAGEQQAERQGDDN